MGVLRGLTGSTPWNKLLKKIFNTKTLTYPILCDLVQWKTPEIVHPKIAYIVYISILIKLGDGYTSACDHPKAPVTSPLSISATSSSTTALSGLDSCANLELKIPQYMSPWQPLPHCSTSKSTINHQLHYGILLNLHGVWL